MPASSPAQAVRNAGGVTPGERLVSVDALRGFDMLWIAGADALGSAVRGLDGGPLAAFIGGQLDHAAWEGFRFFDLIFPLFVFIMGVAIPFSLGRTMAAEGRDRALNRIVRRALLLYLLGLFYYGGLSTPLHQIRFMGVLQRLAICYFAAGLLFVYLKPRALVATCMALLVGYWVLLTFVPVPGIGAGNYAEGANLADWIDRICLPGRKGSVGLLSSLPAVASCLLGVFAGMLLLRDRASPDRRKAVWLAAAGGALLVIGCLWGLQFPIIKKIWTSSYVLVAGGWSALLLAAFFLVIDVWRKRTWAVPFVWIGTNALTIYLASNIVDFRRLARRFGGGDIAAWIDAHWTGAGALWLALIGVALCLALGRFLYNRKIFLRL